MDCYETSTEQFERFMGNLYEYANEQVINILDSHTYREKTCVLHRTDSTVFINGTQCIAPTKIDNYIECAWETLNIEDECIKYCNSNGGPTQLQTRIEEMRQQVHDYCRSAHYEAIEHYE